MSWFGLGKKRTTLGKWLDERDISQREVAVVSGVSDTTIGRLCNEKGSKPTHRNALKIVRALQKIAKEEVSVSDFWSDDE